MTVGQTIVYELQINDVILLLVSKETVESSSRSDDCRSKDYKKVHEIY